MDLTNLALAFGSSLTAGFKLYITVLTLGLLNRYEILDLPERLEVLSHPWLLGAASVLLIVEFFADKIPYIDNTWDAIHSFIRIPAGALLAAGTIGDVDEPLLWVAGLAGGLVSFTAHGAKASTRLAVNATPEPFSNWFLSLLEDGLSLAVLYLVATHPYIAIGLTLLLLLFCGFAIFLFYRFLKALFTPPQAVATS